MRRSLLMLMLALAACSCAAKGAKPASGQAESAHALEGELASLKADIKDLDSRSWDNTVVMNNSLSALEERVSVIEDALRKAGLLSWERSPAGIQAPAAPQAPPAPESPKPWPAATKPTAKPAQPAAKSEPRQAPAKGPKGTALYERGLSLVQDEKFESGRGVLQEYVEEEPNGSLMPNALYWIGESYYGEKRYDQAILAFKDITRRFPKHPKAADALLKIGYSYDRLGDKDNARFYLKTLVDEYPKSGAATLGRKRLQELGS